jgi:GPH family glycoside/pentoside/hexuronide:cation symporter
LPQKIPLKAALKKTIVNKNFQLFLVADFSYFISGTFITSGLIYFITVLLQFPESMCNKIMVSLVCISLLFYPIISYLTKKFGKKKVITFSFMLFSLVFLAIFFLGKMPVNKHLQLYSLVFLAAVPMASLSILPNAILSEIIQKDKLDNGESNEAIYFAVRYFFAKIAQTMGIAFFSMFLIYGKDVGHDLGLRITALFGLALCFFATLAFTRFNDHHTSDLLLQNSGKLK